VKDFQKMRHKKLLTKFILYNMKKRLTASYTEMIRFSVREISKKYRTINYGGCGLFAKSLHKALTTKGYDVKFVFLSHTKYARKLIF